VDLNMGVGCGGCGKMWLELQGGVAASATLQAGSAIPPYRMGG
jgi:hypothetical protein